MRTPLLCPRFLRLLFLVPLALGAPRVSHATLPLPYCTFYGQARDEYGWPYVKDAEVVLRVQGRECSRWRIQGMLAPGVNFKLPLELDDGRSSAYATYAALPGQTVQLSVVVQGVERPIIERRVLTAGQPGDLIAVSATVGTDANGDGIPDEWEQLLVDYSFGLLKSIYDVHPQDDFDGDGVSNLDEFRSGTYPFLADDYLRVEETAFVGGKLRLKFLTSPGISYQILASAECGAAAQWQPVPFATSEGAATQQQWLVGDGFFVSVYLELPAPCGFFRLVAQ